MAIDDGLLTSDEHHDWTHDFCGVDPRDYENQSRADAPDPGAASSDASPVPASGAPNGQAGAPPGDAAQLTTPADAGSGQADATPAQTLPGPITMEPVTSDPVANPGGADPGGASPATTEVSLGAPGSAPSVQNDPVWQLGYQAGLASPDTDCQPTATYTPDAAAVYAQGVLAGQAAAHAKAGPAAGAPVSMSFSNPAIQAAYDGAPAPLSPIQVQALQVLDGSQNGPWANLAWSSIAASAAARVVKPILINQKTLGVCASAAALEAEAATNAKGYADEVCHIFSAAELGGTKVNDDLLKAKPVAGMDACDWMMLSAAQDTSNMVLDYKGKPDDSTISPEGTDTGAEEFLIKNLDGCPKTSSLSCAMTGEGDDTKKVQALMSAYGDKVVVMVECDGGMLQGPKGVDGTGAKSCHTASDHVVRLISVSYGGTVTFTIFTWGQNVTFSWDKKRYDSWVWGYVLGAKDASIELP